MPEKTEFDMGEQGVNDGSLDNIDHHADDAGEPLDDDVDDDDDPDEDDDDDDLDEDEDDFDDLDPTDDE